MPELPDVEGFRRVAQNAAGRQIERVDVLDRTQLRGGPASALEGARLGDFRRHGKWLFAQAGEGEVLMHFGMTGLLQWEVGRSERHRWDRVVFVCRGGELRYRNMRKFGAVWSRGRGGSG